ncbi:hypothetical protein B0F90DRAFT_838410 [Multifurca ochricompacta]|uniref:Uncharacterized protein n=1 Tax=Multifurca ochricompacta TaxID=376703 RepID=A0AAD4M0T2_9AGAM|nr:hypothetical protein B0F90DRAFT_838410 [Multifurca ochricompacta]
MWRMLLKASCLARFGNFLQGVFSEPMVIMAVYFDQGFNAREYLVCETNVGNKAVEYTTQTFDLTKPEVALHFIFRLHNFISWMKHQGRKFPQGLTSQLHQANFEVNLQRYKPYNGDGNNLRAAKKQTAEKGQGKQKGMFQDQHVRKALQDAGFNLPVLREDANDEWKALNPLPPTMSEAILSDGSRVVLKLLDAHTNGLNILEYLKDLKSSVNHTIELLSSLISLSTK